MAQGWTLDVKGALNSKLRRPFWVGLIGLIVIALTLLGFYSLESRVERATFRSRELARISRDARSLSVDQETGLRGYLISGNVILLAPKKAADRAIGPKLDTLATLTADNRSQHDRAIAIRRAVSQWNRGYVAPTLERMSRHEPFSDQRDNLAGKELFDGVRGTLDSFIGYQETRYRALLKFDVRLRRTALGLILIEIVIIGVASLASGKRAARHTRQLLETQAMLEEQAVEMEYQTEQLQDQAVHLEEHAHEAEMALKRLADSNKHLEATIAKLQRAEAAATRASAARDETQSLLDSLFDASPVGFGLLDRSLKYTAVNAAMADLCGMPATDVLGIGPRDLVGPETGEEVEAVLRNVMNTGDPVVNVPVRGVLLTDPNIERHWMLSYFPVGKNADGVLGVGIVAVETTDRKRLEDQLRQAEKMEAVGRLAGGVAHDFNNMLTAIKSYSELLLADLGPQSQQHADVEEIQKAADRATALTRQLLAFSRQQMMRPRLMDLNTVVAEAGGLLKPLVGASIELECVLGNALGGVVADPGEIERVIMNLVINARDAMPGGGKVMIETANVTLDDSYVVAHPETPPGDYVMLAVTDTGHGMTKQVRERLFEPFFTTKERGSGTGLGLSTAYGIVKQSGGHIWVYSEVDRGTTFKIYLPLVDATPAPRSPRHAGNGESSHAKGETILLVEDDAAVRVVAARILRRHKYRVLEAANGSEALTICDENGFDLDLVVTDIVMPEMGGPELASRIRAIRPGVKILFTSGYTEDSAMRQTVLQPGAAFLEKPFSLERLTQKVRDVIDTDPPMSLKA